MQKPCKHLLSGLLVVCAFFAQTVWANSAEISLNSDAVRLAVDYELGNNGLTIEGAVIHNQDRGNVVSIGALKFGDAGSEGLNAGVGLKLAYVDSDIDFVTTPVIPNPIVPSSPSGVALALGGKVHYVPAEFNRMNAGAYLWYAPDVLSFDKMDKYQEIGLYVGYNILRDADVFLGYRNVKGGFKDIDDIAIGDQTIDTGVHFGIRGRF